MGEPRGMPPGGVPLSRVLAGIAKEYGDQAVVVAADALALGVDRLSTGIFAFDLAMGGGFPVGNISLLSGGKGSAKSTLALRAIGEWMRRTAVRKIPPKAAWIDTEGVYQESWAIACGVDPSRLLLSRARFAEEAVDVLCALLSAREIEIVALDSVAMLVPAKELESSALDWQQGLQARLVNKMVRRMGGALNAWRSEGAPRTVILLNQVRQKIGGFGPVTPLVEPGGLGQMFGASVTIRTRRVKYEYLDDKDQTNGLGPAWALNGFHVTNSKVSMPDLKGEFRVALRTDLVVPQTGADDWPSVWATAKAAGVVRKVGEEWQWGQFAAKTLGALEALARESRAAIATQTIEAIMETRVVRRPPTPEQPVIQQEATNGRGTTAEGRPDPIRGSVRSRRGK